MARKSRGYYGIMFSKCRLTWSQLDEQKKDILRRSETKIDGLKKFSCAMCDKKFAKSEINVDHIYPISKNPSSLIELIDCLRLLIVDSNKLQVLCKKCHGNKTGMDKTKEKREYKNPVIKEFITNYYKDLSPENVDTYPMKKVNFLHNWITKYNGSEGKKQEKIMKKLDEYIRIHFL